ncbi:hypothetical protein FRC07_012011 [Ceratobasidium sp. 392]|nr:hypothetical protein FRC07_012011 [Ceratobasidium sp. 392]
MSTEADRQFPSQFSLKPIPLPKDIPPTLDAGIGGEYATAVNGLNNPIGLRPLGPGLRDFKWSFGPIDEQGHREIILADLEANDSAGIIPVLAGFANILPATPNSPVTLSLARSLYNIQTRSKTKDGSPIVTIHPVALLANGSPPNVYVGYKDNEVGTT